jgi:UDP-N-acetylmuramoyl-L-alanyl-D-glutamate--2,6-diaminopimelate ligase
MMTKKLEIILNKYGIDDVSFDGASVDWKTQESDENSFLFYNLSNESREQISLAKERIEKSIFKLCFVKGKHEFKIPNVFSLPKEVYNSLEEELLNNLYPIKKDIFFTGITGTNGKTTSIDLIRQLSVIKGLKVLTVGTLGVFLNNKEVDNFNLTSPSYIDLRKTLYKYGNEIDIFAMELSSHALDQNRSGSLLFNKIGWTNFTQDHLDYHNTMEEYLNAKKIVFKKSNEKILIPLSQSQLIEKINNIKYVEQVSVDKVLENPFFKMKYNLDNLALAINCLKPLVEITKEDCEQLTPPDGRFNIINYRDSYIIIDYAHTPDALRSICSELKISFPEKKLITVFGCGGYRDKSKRPQMAKAAQENSDYIIVTSDNPRFEEPQQIIEDTVIDLTENFEICTERAKAISIAFNRLDNSILLIAGKGHEGYIDQNGIKTPYSDLSTIQELIND